MNKIIMAIAGGAVGYSLKKATRIEIENELKDISNKKIYFNPLRDIYAKDYFDNGILGWIDIGNANVSISKMPKPMNRPEKGVGGISGNFVLNINKSGTILENNVVKNIELNRFHNKIRWETWFVYKTYNIEILSGSIAFGSIIFSIKIKDKLYIIKWLNCYNSLRRQWQLLSEGKILNIPDAIQELCYNENYKYDWVYFRLDVDVKNNRYLEFQSMHKIWNLENYNGTDTDNPLGNIVPGYGISSSNIYPDEVSYLFIDSTCISGE